MQVSVKRAPQAARAYNSRIVGVEPNSPKLFNYLKSSPFSYIDGKNVNIGMIRAGLAEMYKGRQPKGFDAEPYRKSEVEAKKSGKGMWSWGDHYVSPKDWGKALSQHAEMLIKSKLKDSTLWSALAVFRIKTHPH